MYERILVPLDGSKVGEAALPMIEELIARFSSATQVEVILLQVISQLSHWVVAGETGARVPYTEKELDMLRQEALSYLEQAGETLRTHGARVTTIVRFGNPADEIIKLCEEMSVNMIAMSTHGRSGLSRWAFGSITEKVLRSGIAPTLTVRAPQGTENE